MATAQPEADYWERRELAKATNQGSALPERGTYTLEDLKKPLVKPEEFDIWFKEVKTILDGFQIGQVIDSSIPRPADEDATEGPRWVTTSKAVRTWLYRNVSHEIVSRMEATGRHILFADSFMTVLKQVIQGKGALARMKIWDEFHDACSILEPRPSEYVSKVLNEFIKAKQLGVGLQPCHALYLITRRLRGAYNQTNMVRSIVKDLDRLFGEENSWYLYTLEQFQSTCNMLVTDLQVDEQPQNISMAAPIHGDLKKEGSATESNQSQPKNSNEEQKKEKSRIGLPEAGTNHDALMLRHHFC